MTVAHYIVFHPERKRLQLQVKAVALTRGAVNSAWHGDVWVDKPNGNEDPFLFFDPWVYTYCHATQLRREPRHSSYVQPGSYIIFCSGDAADDHVLRIDTVFLVGAGAKWQWGKKIGLATEFKQHEHQSSELWMRHLQFGMDKQHKGRYTYLSRMWQPGSTDFSFSPLNATSERTEIRIDEMPQTVSSTVSHGVKGKMPVLLEEAQLQSILGLIQLRSTTKVLRIIEPAGEMPLSSSANAHHC